MKKSILLLACLALPLAALAADAKDGGKQSAKKAGHAAQAASAPAKSASAPAQPASSPREALQASKESRSKFSACQKDAIDKGLKGNELKAAIAQCRK